ncbi:MAG TPA: hypothetical protein VK066_25990 [Chloroflexota bacterium]|nr:hypothetical protein [Chloroflexota bacterium]
MTWQRLGRLVLLCSAVALPVLGGGAVLAQSTGAAALQGRVLRRSDGALFVYRDGLRYGIVPAELTDAQIDAIPDAGVLVERLDNFFALALGPSPASPTPTPTAPAPTVGVVSPTGASPSTSASFDAAVAGLVGQTLRTCGLLGVPVDVAVQQAEPLQGPDGVPHVVVVANVTNVGDQAAQVSLPVELQDNRGRLFQITSAGFTPDLTVLARQYGINALTQQVLEPGLSLRQLWTFEVPTDVQALTLVPDPMSRCEGVVAP